jgi:sulfur-oxidizing protein SoxY
MKRRALLQAGLAAGPLAIAAQAGLLWPVATLAESWPTDAFFAPSVEEAFTALFGDDPVVESDHVRLEAKDVVEDGAIVSIGVRTDLEGALTVTLFSVNNPTPAVGRFVLSEAVDRVLDTRVKMAKTGDLVAVVSADGKHYSARRSVRVAAGGCG